MAPPCPHAWTSRAHARRMIVAPVMFDVLDIAIAEADSPRIEVRPRESAFGTSDQASVYVDGVELGELDSTRGGLDGSWVPSTDRARGCVLSASRTANDAARSDESWGQFLSALRTVLSAQPAWAVLCETDGDQHAVQELRESPERIAGLLDAHRSRRVAPLAFRAFSS